MKRRLFVSAVLSVGLSLGMAMISGCSSDSASSPKAPNVQQNQEKIVMKYSHGVGATLDDPHQWTAVKFKELVEKYSNGKVEVQIYPAGQLGSEARGFQDVQSRVIQATSLAVNNASPFAPSLGFFDLPYLFKNRDEFNTVIDKLWDPLNEQMIKESGNRAIIWFDQGFRVITNSKKPIESMDDLHGLKIRVPQNPMMIGAFQAWGGEPTPISWDETFPALQQQVVDGQENPYTVIYNSKFQEVQKYITDINYKMWIGPVVVNEQWLQSLPEDVREAIIRAGKEASLAEREFIQKMEQDTLKKLTDAGMVHLGTPKDEGAWMEKAMATWPQYYEKIGGTEMLEKVMGVIGREMPKN
ncbi:TRAP transporter substrate-binding protein [Ammoniphilus sp. 3BR4]|uniref:TRAP transporter substrate-binding protein n=1 Tax=Ammoniphilus sp. 3BR4 TaxID=3158265 RepID=UPI003466CB0D